MSNKESKLETFEANIEKSTGLETKVNMRDFNITIDEPENLGGTNKGPNPVEVLLGSLGGCINIVGHMIAEEMNLELKDFKLKVEGDLDPRGFMGKADVPAGFQNIRVKVQKVEGIPEEDLEEFLKRIEGRCPLADTLERSIEVEMNP